MKLEISTWHDICISQAGSQRAGHGAGGETRAGEWQESPNGWRGAVTAKRACAAERECSKPPRKYKP